MDQMAESIGDFVLYLRSERKLPGTVQIYCQGVRKLHRCTGRRSPMAGIRCPKVEAKPVDHLQPEEMKALLAACRGSHRDEAIVRLMLDTGIRRAECAGIRLGDLDLSATRARVLVHGKGSRDRSVPLGARTVLSSGATCGSALSTPGPGWTPCGSASAGPCRTPRSTASSATGRSWPGSTCILTLPSGTRRPRFDDDLWDFTDVTGLPASMPLAVRRLAFAPVTDPGWRLVAKELIFAMLAPRHEAVALLPRANRSVRSSALVRPDRL